MTLGTDQLKRYGVISLGAGAFIIASIRYVPSRIAAILDSPAYVGYLLSLQFALLISLAFAILYVISYIDEVSDDLEENIDQSFNAYLSDLEGPGEAPNPESEPEPEPEPGDDGVDEVVPDGGRTSVRVRANGDESPAPRETGPRSTDRGSRIETSGRGALVGVTVGALLGFLVDLNVVVLGSIAGAAVGNEIEYRATRSSERPSFPLARSDGIPEGLSTDDLFSLLSNRRRRTVIRLLTEDEEWSLGDLARRVAAAENGVEPSALGEDEVRRVYVALFQSHLPFMASLDVVNLDDERITRGAVYEDVAEYGVFEDAETAEADQDALSLDRLFHVLQNRRRREALRALGHSDGPVSLGDLSESIAATENEKQVRNVTSPERKRVYTSLYQTHLPKLDEVGIVEFDQSNGTITEGERFDRIATHLGIDTASRRREEWVRFVRSREFVPYYYLGVTLVAGLVYLARQAGSPVISDLETHVLFSVYAAAVLVPSVYYIIVD